MKEPIHIKEIDGKKWVRAEHLRQMIDALFLLARIDEKVTYRNFSIPVGLKTTVTVSFDGPVGVDEYDSLMAHLAYYKKTVVPLSQSEEEMKNARDRILAKVDEFIKTSKVEK